MRILFIITGFTGLLLAGLVTYEIRIANDYDARIRDVQAHLLQDSRKEVAEVRRSGAVFTGQTLGDLLIPELDGFDTFKKGWFVVAVCSVTLIFVGATGIFMEAKLRPQPGSPTGSESRTPNHLALIGVAIVLALASWPLLFVALVWQFAGETEPPAVILFLSWIVSGLFWGIFVDLTYRMIRPRRLYMVPDTADKTM